ncbi:MAG: antibiotic biosynthesis monooxygenase [Mycobacteriales bacterium]
MIGRVNILQADPSKIDAGIAFVRDRIQPLVDSLPGSRGLGMWVNRETGDVVVNTVWDDRAALDASEGHVTEVRAEAAEIVGAKTVRVELGEPIVVWQAAADQPGYWSRSVEMDVPTDRIEEGIAVFRDELLPSVQQIPGVNTVVLSLNRDTGHTMLNVTYRSRAELDAARATADKLRAGIVSRFGAGEPTVRELETTIVGIRGPATIDLTATESRAEV